MFKIGDALAPDCVLCAGTSASGVVCPACAAELPILPSPRCPQCALPTPDGQHCGRCLAHPPHYDRTLAALRYDFPLDKLVQSFKYGQQLALAGYFGELLVRLLDDVHDADCIVPLPLHVQRLRQRGFNQALELARPLARATRLPLDTSSCRRTRPTTAQADLPWNARQQNVRGAFRCTADCSGRHVLLVDDVMTTGATLDACASALKRSGARRVTLLVLARALPS